MTKPTFLSVFQEVVQKLDAARIDYMIVGSVAAMAYGDPRMTQDMDIVVDIVPAQVRLFAGLFPEAEYYSPPHEVLVTEALGRRSFNILHLQSGLKVDFMVRKSTAHAEMEFVRRKRISILPGLDVWMAAPEDVIIKKLDFYREGGSEKHLRDIRGILATTEVDHEYMGVWVKKLGLESQWVRATTV